MVLLLGGGAAQARPQLYVPPRCPDVRFHSEPWLGPQRVCMNLGVRTHGTEPGTYLFLTPEMAGVGIYRDNGALVWWHRRPAGATDTHDAGVVRLWGHRYLAVWSGRARTVGHDGVLIRVGTVALYNQHYQRVGTVTAGRPFAPNQLDMHEFRVTPEGDALVGVYKPVTMVVHGHPETVLDDVVQKLSLVRTAHGIRTGKVLFQWSSLQHVPLSASRLPDPGSGGVWDYFHLNAVSQDADGNLVISARHTWGIYKINVSTGSITWQLGARGDPTLRVPWCYQHDVTALGHDEYSLFDDGGQGPGCWPRLSWHQARGLIIRVNPTVHPARVQLVRSYTHQPLVHSDYVGSTQRLDDGNVLVSWGTTPVITEYSADGRRVLMDLSLSQQTYRGLRFAWTGRPLQPPTVAAQLRTGGTDVWASWNGSTEVTAWRVLAGPVRGHLRAVTPPIPRTGFETAIDLPHRYQEVEVQALDSHDRPLKRSPAVERRPAECNPSGCSFGRESAGGSSSGRRCSPSPSPSGSWPAR